MHLHNFIDSKVRGGVCWGDAAIGFGHPETPLSPESRGEMQGGSQHTSNPWEIIVSGAREGIGHTELLLHEKLAAAARGFDCTEQTGAGCSSQMLLCRNIQ